MSALQSLVEEVSNSLPYIPSSQNFWLNRTNDGAYYDLFKEKKIVGLKIDEITLFELSQIRDRNLLRNGRPNRDVIQIEIKNIVHEKNKKRLLKIVDKSKRSAELARLTMTANQIFHFAFGIKKGDFVVIPSASSTEISIGRIDDGYLDDNQFLPLQRKVTWLGSYPKITLDPNFYRLFFSQQALTEINKYKDVVLRTLYDFYFDDEYGHLVFNVGTLSKINAVDEAAFNFYFLQLLDGFIKENNLPYDVTSLNTIVNLNSPGKRKLFGPRTTIFLAACLLLMTVGGGLEHKKGTFSLKTEGILQGWSEYLNQKKRREIVDEVINKSDSLSIEKQKLFLELLETLDSK
ncbi:hypothetical protein [Roseivirga sp. UBA838]|uniref:hypothetical protein n=1 Tax=Roseivirga sp. UBA838 TaxID=1947393 RepID=UPI00257A30F5|nr:hypothetical protein [Roseivirga sp. UBA838]|tara:strand:+ start:27426 stop:28469 length:1044 start_codon:yes stop_codon:yes gene_type:complete